MKTKHSVFAILFTFFGLVLNAQIQLQNGSMQSWIGFNQIRPEYWGTTEQLLGIHYNKWVKRENLPEYVHSGSTSVCLFSDTFSASSIKLWPGIIAYGKIAMMGDRIISTGLPIYGRPLAVSLYIRINHPVVDTASIWILLTRWNPVRSTQDTMAYEQREIFPDSLVMTGFAHFTDTLSYRLDGEADTARIVITGGRNGDTATRGNAVWLDDIRLVYAGSQVVHQDLLDDVFLYPNPAVNTINIHAVPLLAGYSVVLQNTTGIIVKQAVIDEGLTRIDVADLPEGSYCFAILNRDKLSVREGNINISRP